jgi:hypothetical protein
VFVGRTGRSAVAPSKITHSRACASGHFASIIHLPSPRRRATQKNGSAALTLNSHNTMFVEDLGNRSMDYYN